MKKIFLAIALFCAFGIAAEAQDVKKENKAVMKVKVIEEKDGNTNVQEHTYNLDDLSKNERDAKVKVIMDTIRNKNGKGKRMEVTINDSDEFTVKSDDERFDKLNDGPKKKKEVRVYRYNDGDGGDKDVFKWDGQEFANRMKKFEKDFGPKFEKQFKDFKFNWNDNMPHWNGDKPSKKPASIRGLMAYPNNPDKDELNVRFNAPAKGDVTISIADTKGKVVAKKEVKDFSGDYIGQIELGKNAKGTLFITVTQNEDGAVKRVVIE